MSGYCEVALTVPLRTTFTYAVPDALDELVVPGARVVVPFRNRAMVGVVLDRTSRHSVDTPLKDVAEVLDVFFAFLASEEPSFPLPLSARFP